MISADRGDSGAFPLGPLGDILFKYNSFATPGYSDDTDDSEFTRMITVYICKIYIPKVNQCIKIFQFCDQIL